MNHYKQKRKTKKQWRNVIIAFACKYGACGEKIVLVPSTNGRVPVNYSSLSFQDKEMLRKGFKIIYRHKDHVSHFATCKK